MNNDFASDVVLVSGIDAVPKILEVICRMTGMGFAAVARVTDERWIACAVRDEIQFGLEPGGELKIETTFCSEIRDSRRGVVIDNVAEDQTYCGHAIPAMYGFQSYISMPIIRADGSFFGTLCAIDPKPARLNTPETTGMFRLFAELIALHLDTQDRLAASEAALRDERKTAELREQFIAVLGHDLRNPLASIDAGARVLRRALPDERSASVIDMIQNSVRRMSGLINDVMDFARTRLGGGLPMDRKSHEGLAPVLHAVIAELRAAWPQSRVEAHIDLAEPVYCDPARIAQLLSNLVANALTHGDRGGVVSVSASSNGNAFELSVTNTGEPIAPDTMKRVFEPFSRADAGPSHQGLGLGLYIASEIARTHGGTLEVSSTLSGTCFTFRMPTRQIAQ